MDSSTAVTCKERSRNIVYSKLLMRKDDAKEFAQQLLVTRYGLPSESLDEVSLCAEIGVFKGNHNHKKLFQSPLYTIPLKGASIEDAPTSMDDSKSLRDSKKSLNKHSFQFGLATADGHSYKFRVRDAREHRTWTNLIKFLAMFPHSIVPVMPSYDPSAIINHLSRTLSPKDSVWPVYVMPEEVGLRCRLEGPKILVLEKQNESNKLEVYSQDEQCSLMFSCMHSEIRRIGKMGIFLYVEVGRRCLAGPGLLWLFFGNNNDKAIQMKEILCRFLLNKDPIIHQHSYQSPMTQHSYQTPRMTRSFTAPLLSEALNSPPPPASSPPPPPPASSPPPPPHTSSPPPLPLPNSSPRTGAPLVPNIPPPPIPASPRPLGSNSPITPGSIGSPRQSFSPVMPSSTLTQQIHSIESRKQSSKVDLALVSDEPTQQKYLCNSYHTLELQDTSQASQYHTLEPSQDNPSKGSLYHILDQPQSAGQAPMYHILEPHGKSPSDVGDSPKRARHPCPYHITDLRNRTCSVEPQGYRSLDHSLEATADVGDSPKRAGHPYPYHITDLQSRTGQTSPQYSEEPQGYRSLEHSLEATADAGDSPKRARHPYPYHITDLQSRTGQSTPQCSVEPQGYRSLDHSLEATTEAGMERNTCHVLEPPPTGKHSKQHGLESSRSQRALSEKPRRHKLNTGQLHNSYHELEPPASKDTPQQHLYHEIGDAAKPGRGLSQSLVLRPDKNQASSVPTPQQPQYHVLEASSETRQPPHQYDAVNTRISQRHSEQNNQQQYNMLGLRQNVKAQSSSQVPVYNTIGKN